MTDPNAGYATPRLVRDITDCHFYHSMDLPGHGTVQGEWDLRGDIDGYLGHADFAGRRVLEIGPASGFCTVAMEQRGAEVVALELPDHPGWDFVPYPESRLAPLLVPRQAIMNRLKNSWWFVHAAHQLRARQVVAHAEDVPDFVGRFDMAVLTSVLLHCKNPLAILQACARHARDIVITEVWYPDLEGRPVCEFVPDGDNFMWHTWWRFSSGYFVRILQVMGFTVRPPVLSTHSVLGQYGTRVFSLVATREPGALP